MSFNAALQKLQPDQIEFLLKNSVRRSSILGYDFEGLHLGSWKFLKETAPILIKTGNFEKLIIEAFKDRGIGIFYSDVNNADYNECLYFIFWVIDEIQAINKMEADNLSADPDVKLLAAGINEMNQFGDLNTIDSLVIGWCGAYTHEEVKNMPYHFIFDKQLKTKVETNINKKLAKQK